MRAFKFKLERILALRKYREREREIKLAEATGECVQLRRDIADRQQRKRDMLAGQRGFGTAALLDSHLYMTRMQQESDKKTAALDKAEIRREEMQKEYLEASKDRKVLDKLKEKRSAGYLKEQRVEEVKEVDDINTGRASRRGDGTWQDTE